MDIERNESMRDRILLETYVKRMKDSHQTEVNNLRNELVLQKQQFYEEKKRIIQENKEKWDRNQGFFED